MQFPLTISSKGMGGKRKVHVRDAGGQTDKKAFRYHVSTPDGAKLGFMSLTATFSTRDFEIFGPSGASVARISGTGVGREMLGSALGGLVGAAVRGKGAEYVIELSEKAAIGLTRLKRREARVDAEGEIPPDQANLIALCLIPWAAFSLT